MSKEIKLMPKLRFPEFENGKWNIKTVDAYCDVYRGSAFSKADMIEDGSEPCIHYGELFTKYNEVITEILSRTNKKDGFRSESGDVLMPSSDVTPDGLAKASAITLDGVILGGDMNILRPKTEINSVFLSYLLNHSKREIIKLVSGTTVKHIYPSQIITCEIPVIDNEIEQQKIASCLSSLDELLAAHNDKLDALKDHKKGLMQNLFPNCLNLDFNGLEDVHDFEGEKKSGNQANQENHSSDNVPKVRFPEFEGDGEWVEKTIGEFAPLQRGFDLPVDNIVIGDYPVVFSNGILKYHNEFKVNGPGVVTGRSGTIGKVTYVEKDFWPHNTSLWVTNFCGNFPMFVFYYFVSIGLQQFSAGGGVPTLNRNDVHRHNILVPPTIQEQQKIASCLSAVDELITAQAEKIEQLQQHKKGLMQGLFPKIES
jgi:type I restriction enzyme, S subunit